MLTGRRAFGADAGYAATLAAIITQEPAPLRLAAPATPAALDRIVSQCLRKDAAERYPSAAELLEALDQCAHAPEASSRAPSAAPARSIAVLPFTNLGADPDSDYFSDGLAEEILNALAQVPGLRVVARASAFAFRNRADALAEIASKLRVGSVLQGSVRRAGGRLRVTAQLVDVREATQLWSERYDREMADVFAIQDEVARAIVEKLKLHWQAPPEAPLVKAYTRNPEAHNLYLKGVYHGNRFTPADWAKARELLQQAVALEPGHAAAWAHLAEYQIHRASGGELAPGEAMPQAADAARRALAADAQLADAHAGLAFVEAFYDHRWRDGLERVEAASALPGTTWSRLWSANVRWSNGQFEAAERTLLRAVELDPLAFIGHFLLARFYNARGAGEPALRYATEAMSLVPNAGSFAMLGIAHGLLGDGPAAVHWLEQARQAAPFFPPAAHLAAAYVRAGRRADAEQLMQAFEQGRRERYVAGTALAQCALALDRPEQALGWLEQAADEHDLGFGFLPGARDFAPLHAHPRYAQVMRRVGLPPS